MEQLKKFEGQFVVIFEKNAILVATLDKVIDVAVVRVVDGSKTFSPGDFGFGFSFNVLYISACEITEFIPLASAAEFNAMRDSVIQQMQAKANG